nr:uncharacterized protein LOC109402861 [Aedes albopictus]
MSHLAAKYMRNFRKRAKEQQPEISPKRVKTTAERVRCHRAKLQAAKGKASPAGPTGDWDAGEGPSTRVFNTTRTAPVSTPLLNDRGESVVDGASQGVIVPSPEDPQNEESDEAVSDGSASDDDADIRMPPATQEPNFDRADREFRKRFLENEFGHSCDVCARIWFRNDLKPISGTDASLLLATNYFESAEGFSACLTCRSNLKRGLIPSLSQSNGFTYPRFPANLPPLDPLTVRLVSPRINFMQLRRLRYAAGSLSIIGQIINVPVDVAQMVSELPRQLDDDHAFNVCIKRHMIHKSSYLSGYVKKGTVKAWLNYLVTTPLYRRYGIVFNEDNLAAIVPAQQPGTSASPSIDLEVIDASNDTELLIGQQHTLLWDEDKCLEIAPGQNRTPLSIIYDEFAEELSFPDIYLGHPRTFKPEVRVTPFMMATSEIRRRDRRGARPEHILFMAMKIMRLRVSEGLKNTFKCMGTANITRAQLQDRNFLESCIDRNLSFLKSIPNSVQYWQQRKRDVFAMIRQLGKPTMFLTVSANEIRWPHLLEILQKLANGCNEPAAANIRTQLTALQRATLVSEDPVTCCAYFNKFVNVLMQLLSSSRYSPFGKFYVVDYFKRIEFQHRGSPHAHILLWLANDPREAVSENMPATVELIDALCSVSVDDLPETYGNQVHKHTFTCFKRNDKRCRFNIPYWPMDQTRILIPITAGDGRLDDLRRRAVQLRDALETKSFDSLEAFLVDSNCTYEYYLDVIRASIRRPTFVLEEFSCAAYVVEYVNKTNRGISSLHRELVKLQEEHPESDYNDLLKKVSIKMLNAVEMSAQEAAWYLLRQPMSEASRKVEFIPTMWPHERIKSRKRTKQMDEEELEDDSTDVWTLNVIQKYESRTGMDDICLADFVACYTEEKNAKNSFKLRSFPRVIRWCAYNMSELVEYKREMVLLFLPFRNEVCDILDRNKFLQLYEGNEATILAKLKEYDCEINLDQVVDEYIRLSDEDDEQQAAAGQKRDEFVRTITMEPNDDDIQYLPTGPMAAVVKQRSNVLSKQEYCEMVRATNAEQRDLILQVIDNLHSFSDDSKPVQIFFTGPAGCGKTFTLRILMETVNRFSQAHNSQSNAYVACASTGKAAVAIGGTTVHSAFRITMSRRQSSKLSFEARQLYRNAFANVKVIIVDETSMLGADVLNTVHARLQEITGNYDDPFGGMSIVFCGDLRQLPPVNARPVFKPSANSMHGAVLWQSLEFYPLVQVMRQANVEFSSILTKIGNGEQLSPEEIRLIESRFRTTEWCQQHVPQAIRLFHRNADVERYNTVALMDRDAAESTADDVYSGYKDNSQLVGARTKVHKMSVVEAGGLPYLLRLVVGTPYMITTNIDVEDGLVNGAIGELMFVEHSEDDPQQQIVKLWFNFENSSIGKALRVKARPLVYSKPGVLNPEWTPIAKRSANINLNGGVKCRRMQFPVVSACALTVHKSQGGTFSEVVFSYEKGQEQQLVYVGFSRVTSLEGLFLTNPTNSFRFHHGKGAITPRICDLRTELERLNNHRLRTIGEDVMEVISSNRSACTMMSLNVQSLNAHSSDIATDRVLCAVDLLALSETWVNNSSRATVAGFHCIAQEKRTGVRAGGVAILQSTQSSTMAVAHEINKLDASYDPMMAVADEYGDICAIELPVMGTRTLLFSLYLSPGTTLKEKKFFLARNLIHYFSVDTPVVVTGDFNIDVSKPDNFEFIDFMRIYLRLELASDRSLATTLGGSCLDLTFMRNIRVACTRYCAYFSYHRPILSVLELPCEAPICSSHEESS